MGRDGTYLATVSRMKQVQLNVAHVQITSQVGLTTLRGGSRAHRRLTDNLDIFTPILAATNPTACTALH
jgi:hypothetical protein